MFTLKKFLTGTATAERSFASRFTKDEAGSFGVIFGLSLTVLMLGAGMALDYSRMSQTKGIVGGALDAAVLSAGHDMAEGVSDVTSLRKTFDKIFMGNIQSRNLADKNVQIVSFSADINIGKIAAEVSSDVPMGVMSIAGYESVQVKSFSEATFSTNPVEITMMLDVTGSMKRNGKLTALKRAATDAINILIPPGKTSDRVRVGLVPYSWSVNAGDYAAKVTNGKSQRCVTERENNSTELSYEDAPLGADVRVTKDNLCPQSSILPLTSNSSKLRNEISNYKAEGYTAGHLGVAWSYYMLSQEWQKLWNASSKPSDYGAGIQKIAILMTDGEFNTYFDGTMGNAFGPYGNQSSEAAIALCDDMKADRGKYAGITIYSVAFDAPKSAQKTLRTCASADSAGNSHYFAAESEAELRQAFTSIARSIQKLRLSR